LYLTTGSVFADRQLYKEFVQVILKLQSNFQIRDLQKSGESLLEVYLNEVFQFTINSFKAGSRSSAIMANASKLCFYW
jgi:hypothetical protein